MKKMVESKKKSWFRRHWILSTILGFFLFFFIAGMFYEMDNGSTGNAIKDSNSQDNLIITDTKLLLPQDSEVDRIWQIKDIVSITLNATGFVEGSKRTMSKAEFLGGSSITTEIYRFDSIANAMQFYNQEKQKIDIRGVEEWGLGNGCFGIEKDSTLAGYAKGVCLRNNFVFYIKSVSSSYS